MLPSLHILIGNNVYPPIMAGGAELIVQYLAEGLAARGHRVTVVSTCGPEMEPYPAETRNGVEVIRFFPKNLYWHWTRGARPGYQKALWHLRDAWNSDAGRKFNAILTERKPDVLHTHLIDGLSAILWRRAKRQGVPVVHTAHDYHLLCPRSVMLTKRLRLCTDPTLPCQLYRRWHLHTARDIDIFCSPSQFLLDKHRASGLDGLKMSVVANGIPLPSCPPKKRSEAAETRFLFAARLTEEKGCQVILEALRQLPKDLPMRLAVAGKGPYEEAFRRAAAEDSRLELLGYIQGEQKHAAFSNADFLLLPSLWYENAPVVIVEAAAYGLGVIGSDIGAIPEFVHHEKNGLLFALGDPKALAAAMSRAVREPKLFTNLATETADLLERSSITHMVKSYENIYLQFKNQRVD